MENQVTFGQQLLTFGQQLENMAKEQKEMKTFLEGFGGMGGFGTGATGSTGLSTDFKVTYAAQLVQLQGMGFTNEATNLEALKATGGNVEAAVERIKKNWFSFYSIKLL